MFSRIKNGLSKVADGIGDAARVVTDKASDAYDATASGLSSAGSIVADVAGSAKDVVAETARTAAYKAGDAIDATASGLSSAGSVVSDVASEAKDVIGGVASSAYETSRDYAGAIVSGEKDIRWGKVMLGASVGVAAVAAAPFTGGGSLLAGASLAGSLAGAGAAAGAAAVAGGVVANKLSDDSKVREAAYREGVKDTKAQHQLELEHRRKSLEAALHGLKGAAEHYNAIIAMHAVAVATANCDGVICDKERENIELFIAGISVSSIPVEVTAKLKSLYDSPPSIRDAWQLAKNSGVAISVFDEIIQIVIHADDVQHPQEDAFLQAWNTLKLA